MLFQLVLYLVAPEIKSMIRPEKIILNNINNKFKFNVSFTRAQKQDSIFPILLVNGYAGVDRHRSFKILYFSNTNI